MKIKWLSPILYIPLILVMLFSSCKSKQHLVPVTKQCFEKLKLTTAQERAIRKEIHATEKTGRIDSLFQKKHLRQGFNGTVLIAQKGVVLYENVFGYQDFTAKTPLYLNSAFQLASISKTFTGVAILMMVQEGKLKITDSIQKFFPDFPYHGISIENLLSHRSGLPNYLYTFEDKHRSAASPPTNDSILNWFIQADPIPPAYGKPGVHFSYNNSNYVILACILQKVSRMKYADFIRSRILLPLEMLHSYIDTIAPDSLLHLRTSGHDGNHTRERDFYDGVYGDKGVYSTVEDIAKWYYALQNECLLNHYWLNQAFTPRSFEKKGRHNYGLGFRLMTQSTNMKKVEYIYHGGWWAGYSTMLWSSPSYEYVIIILGNKKSMAVYEIKPIIEILEEKGKADEEAGEDATDSL